MTQSTIKTLTPEQQVHLLKILETRFAAHPHRHKGVKWEDVAGKIESNREKMWTLSEMERTGGEPDVTGYDPATEEFIFCDCSKESPVGRRSLCYDRESLETRKENKPAGSALEMAESMGIQVLNEHAYRALQHLEPFDTKTSSWIVTPKEIRILGGALFGDFRYGAVFIYHNGASSYYAARGFRGMLRV
jgi:hypothetical protein